MSTFKPLNLDAELVAAEAASAVKAAQADTLFSAHQLTFSAFQEIPWNLIGTLLTGRSQVAFRTPYLDNEVVALAYRAPNSVRSSALPALRLIERQNPELARIPTDRGQIGSSRGAMWVMRRIFAETTFKMDYLHTAGLPGSLAPFTSLLEALKPTGLLGLHKFLPYSRWFGHELLHQIGDILASESTRTLPFLNSVFVRSMLTNHSRGRKNYVNEISAVVTLSAINRLLLNAG